MSGPLTNIANRLTPSVPIEFTFGAQPIATGRKFTTIFGHMASAPGTATPYQVYTVINVGDPVAAANEITVLAGADSQIGAMAVAFINAATQNGANYPAFRIVLIPFNVSNFGPNQEAINNVSTLRSDMFVSCYPASDAANYATLNALVQLISGIDRDLAGQFGSFATYGDIDPLATQIALNLNNPMALVATLPDSNTAAVPITGTTTTGSPQITAVAQPVLTPTGTTTALSTMITAVSDTSGIYPGASITGTGIPGGTTIEQILGTTLVISQEATSSNASEPLTITNLPTAGIYPGALLSGTGIPAGTEVLSVAATTITMNQNATSSNVSEAIGVQNQVSQPSEIVAAAHGGGVMASQFPYFPMTGIPTGLTPPQISSDWIQINPAGSSEAALVAGLSPLFVANGVVKFLRTRTTWTMNGLIPVVAYFDWQDLVTLNDFREDVFLIAENPPFNNNPGGTKNSLAIANQFRDEVLREAQSYEDQFAFQAVQSLANQFQVAPSTTSRGRFDFKIPVNVLPGLYVIAGNIQAVTTFDFTL